MQILKEEIYERIRKVSEDLFYNTGYEGTTTRSIAAKVGISVSNLYLYYENKEAILAAVIEPYYDYINSRLKEFLVLEKREEDINEKLSEVVIDLITRDQRKFIILSDRCNGTRFEASKGMVVQIITRHMKALLNNTICDKDLIAYILASNLINAIIEMAKNYHDERQLKDSLKNLITYHTQGLRALVG
jgi:AcrR family transcriptional regulator